MSKYNYYTPIELAALLLELIPQKASISSAIDICCGSWNLLAAAKRHYPEVKITGVDIDPAAHAHCIEGATFVCDDGRSFANRQEKAKQIPLLARSQKRRKNIGKQGMFLPQANDMKQNCYGRI